VRIDCLMGKILRLLDLIKPSPSLMFVIVREPRPIAHSSRSAYRLLAIRGAVLGLALT
jgi:hypothetical protein